MSIVSNICPIENINKANYEYARNSYFKYLLLRAAKTGDQVYENDNNLNDEYGQPLLKIKENFDRLDYKTKSLVLEFVKREIYDETVDFKCLNCFYEEPNQDWESIEEMWNGIDYPILYCPKCGKGKFVPLEI